MLLLGDAPERQTTGAPGKDGQRVAIFRPTRRRGAALAGIRGLTTQGNCQRRAELGDAHDQESVRRIACRSALEKIHSHRARGFFKPLWCEEWAIAPSQ